ncbi:MAG TPA: hypothetical protein VNV41_00235 [Candidatus Acidoferrales bacterium]|nr:hypothetical protein [Candidatus Acidoferrales bacterium]
MAYRTFEGTLYPFGYRLNDLSAAAIKMEAVQNRTDKRFSLDAACIVSIVHVVVGLR